MSAVELARIVGGWATLATTLLLLVGAVFALYQLRIATKARRLQALVSIYQQVRPREIIEAEQALLEQPERELDIDGLTESEVRKINSVIYSYQRLGYFLYQGLVTEEEVLPMVGWESIVLWEKLKGYIRDRLRRDIPHARAHFEYLAARSDYYIRMNPSKIVPAVAGFDANLDELVRTIQRGERLDKAPATRNHLPRKRGCL